MNRIGKQFSKHISRGEKLFIPYVMAGDGGLEVLGSRLSLLEKLGAAAIEIGIPFSDPVADGPTIQKAGIRALQAGTNLKKILKKLREVRGDISIPLIIMTYMNPILAYGIDHFVTDLKAASIDGCILPDLPVEEEDIIVPKLEKEGIEVIRLVTMTTPPERIRMISEKGKGFLYTVTVKGITGTRKEFDDNIFSFLKMVKSISPIPVIAGFGVSSPDQVSVICQHCDGVVVGSKVVELFAEDKLDELVELVQSIQQLKVT